MLRTCLLLGMAVPVWAIPISGEFSFSSDTNFVNVTGPGFAWQFHQGESSTVYRQCEGDTCSLDGSGAPAMFAFINSDNWFLAAANSLEAYANVPGKPTKSEGTIGGSLTWHVSRTAWRDIPIGTQTAVTLPMEVGGLLTASDSRGNFMNSPISGHGQFETEVVRFEGGVAFLGASGKFEGDVDPVPEPAAYTLAAAGILLGSLLRRQYSR